MRRSSRSTLATPVTSEKREPKRLAATVLGDRGWCMGPWRMATGIDLRPEMQVFFMNVGPAVDFSNPFQGERPSPVMKQNAAHWDRILRAIVGLAMLVASFMAPVPMLVRVLAFGMMGVYMLATALIGTCLGYKMMGMSTCPIKQAGSAQ